MAKLKNGIFGPISGKLGPIVGAIWNGIAYLRPLPEKPKKPKPRTVAQTANEQKLKFMNMLLVPFHPYITIGFQHFAINNTAISAAYSTNYYLVLTGVYPNLGVDYSKIIVSKGNLPGLNQPVMSLEAPDTLEITWLQNTLSSASFDDQVMLVIYSPELQKADGFTGGHKRSAKRLSFQFDHKMVGKILEVYISVISNNRKRIANSLYMGRVNSL